MTVFLPPEAIVIAFGLCRPEELPDLDTSLRGAYALGTTPMFFTAMLPASVEEITPEDQERYQHYADLYKSFIRPLLPTCRAYHLAPVNATGGVDSGEWLALQFLSPDREKGWALIVKLSETDPDTYLLQPRGLDDAKSYKVSFDNTRTTKVFSGADLLRDGITISVEPKRRSELLLLEAE
jgi:hypothetical protein